MFTITHDIEDEAAEEKKQEAIYGEMAEKRAHN